MPVAVAVAGDRPRGEAAGFRELPGGGVGSRPPKPPLPAGLRIPSSYDQPPEEGGSGSGSGAKRPREESPRGGSGYGSGPGSGSDAQRSREDSPRGGSVAGSGSGSGTKRPHEERPRGGSTAGSSTKIPGGGAEGGRSRPHHGSGGGGGGGGPSLSSHSSYSSDEEPLAKRKTTEEKEKKSSHALNTTLPPPPPQLLRQSVAPLARSGSDLDPVRRSGSFSSRSVPDNRAVPAPSGSQQQRGVRRVSPPPEPDEDELRRIEAKRLYKLQMTGGGLGGTNGGGTSGGPTTAEVKQNTSGGAAAGGRTHPSNAQRQLPQQQVSDRGGTGGSGRPGSGSAPGSDSGSGAAAPQIRRAPTAPSAAAAGAPVSAPARVTATRSAPPLRSMEGERRRLGPLDAIAAAAAAAGAEPVFSLAPGGASMQAPGVPPSALAPAADTSADKLWCKQVSCAFRRGEGLWGGVVYR